MINTELYFTYDCISQDLIEKGCKFVRESSLKDEKLLEFIINSECIAINYIEDFNSIDDLHNFLLSYTIENIIQLPYKCSVGDIFYFYNFKEVFDSNNVISKYFIDLFNFGCISVDLEVSQVELSPKKICIHLSKSKR